MSRTIVVLNPNSSESVTDALSTALEPLRFPGGPTIHCDTLASGPPAIETDEQVAEAGVEVCNYLRRHAGDAGAFVIACFSDPGLREAREQSTRPVFGMAEGGLLTALTRGRRFGIVSILPASVPRHLACIRALGIEERLAADLPIGLGVHELTDESAALRRMVTVGAQLRDEHGADVVVMGCAGMASLRQRLQDALGIPVIDPVQAAVSMAIGTVAIEINGDGGIKD